MSGIRPGMPGKPGMQILCCQPGLVIKCSQYATRQLHKYSCNSISCPKTAYDLSKRFNGSQDLRIQYLATPQIWEEKLQFTWGRLSSQTFLPLKLPAISRTKNPINRDPRCPASRGAFPACRLSAAGRASHSGVHSMPTCQLDIVQCLQKCKLITTHSFVSSVTTSRCSSHRPEPKDLPKHSSNPKIRHLQTRYDDMFLESPMDRSPKHRLRHAY